MFENGLGNRGRSQTHVGNNVIRAGMELSHVGNSKSWNAESEWWLISIQHQFLVKQKQRWLRQWAV